MNTNQILSKAKQFIAEDFLQEALELIGRHFGQGPFEKEVLMLSNQFARMKNNLIADKLSISEAQEERGKINSRLLDLLERIKTRDKLLGDEEEQDADRPPQIMINESKNINTGTINANGGDVHIGDSN